MEKYIRNYVSKSELQPGTPIRMTEPDASADAVAVGLKPGVLILQRPDATQFPVRWSDGVYPHKFPRRNDAPVHHKFPCLATDLRVDDRVSFISEHAVVQSVYRRPGADWARITITDLHLRKRITKVVDPERELTRNYLFNRGAAAFDLAHVTEKAGPYKIIGQDGYVWFMVHPTGRGRYPLLDNENDVRQPPEAGSKNWTLRYEFVGRWSTERHPNDSQSKTGSDWV